MPPKRQKKGKNGNKSKSRPALAAFVPYQPSVVAGQGSLLALIRAPPPKIHLFTKWINAAPVSQALLDTFGVFSFRMNMLAESASFAVLFQSYQIRRIDAFFRPMYRGTSIIDDNLVVAPQIYVAMDPNDITNWALLSEAQRYENVVVMGDDTPFCYSFCPLPVGPQYRAGVFNGFSNAAALNWQDTSYPDNEHYGLHWAITGNGLAANYQAWSVSFRCTIAFVQGK